MFVYTGHSGSRRAPAWRRGATEREYLVPLLGSVKKPYIVELHHESKNPGMSGEGCQSCGPGHSVSQRALVWRRVSTERGCPGP